MFGTNKRTLVKLFVCRTCIKNDDNLRNGNFMTPMRVLQIYELSFREYYKLSICPRC